MQSAQNRHRQREADSMDSTWDGRVLVQRYAAASPGKAGIQAITAVAGPDGLAARHGAQGRLEE
jgi:hypothetical protein